MQNIRMEISKVSWILVILSGSVVDVMVRPGNVYAVYACSCSLSVT